MHQNLNTLYVTTQGAYVTRDHETLRVKIDGQVRLTVPLHHLQGLVCFGRIGVSPAVLGSCGDHGLCVSFLSLGGRFLARVEPPAHGNVLLRREQYRWADDPQTCLRLARPLIAAKIQNSRNLLLRAARELAPSAPSLQPNDSPGAAPASIAPPLPETGEARNNAPGVEPSEPQPVGDTIEEPAMANEIDKAGSLRRAADHMAAVLLQLPQAAELNAARGIEGTTARTYFGVLSHAIRQQTEAFHMQGRTRRPPRDPLNALLSFLYALVQHDCSSALQAVGLDPAVGFLHADRPGRLSLSLDLMEQFRPLVADRLALALINRRQVQADGFTTDPGGAVRMDDKTRRTLLTAYQERKREQVQHPLLKEAVPVGLLFHIQARLLARTIRGEYPEYPALVLR